MTEANAEFNGWALIELYGHGREVGYVTTRYFGTACMFQVDVPELPERESTLTAPQFHGRQLLPAGAVVKKAAVPGRSRMLGPGSIYAMNPCTEDAARAAIERSAPRDIALVSLPEGHQLESGETEEEDERYTEDED